VQYQPPRLSIDNNNAFSMLVVALALFFSLAEMLFALVRRFGLRRRPTGYRRISSAPRAFVRSTAKPAWVRREIIRLKALMPQAGCRRIADSFNRRFAASRKMTVGKTIVSHVIRQHRYEIEVERCRIKNAKPRPVPKNLVWGLDLTGKVTLEGETRLILGVIEHASRAALWLEALQSKSSWVLIGKLAEAIKRYGKPKAVRTDNETVFSSSVFRLALFLLGIRHQRTDFHCPWQNGRVERFFGTLKEKLDRLAVESVEALNGALGEFRFFYNHVRPHQNLGGRTPAEAWAGVDPFTARISKEFWFEAWEGLLQGYYLRR
jgi:putative transposase